MQAHHCCGCMAGGVAPHNAEPLWVQHWSNRKGWDRRKTLWGSWAVHSHAKPGLRFWFAGDHGSILRSIQVPQDPVRVSCAERGCSYGAAHVEQSIKDGLPSPCRQNQTQPHAHVCWLWLQATLVHLQPMLRSGAACRPPTSVPSPSAPTRPGTS